jgi:glycosyltransferase involved in cell wall biosynthesis
MGTMGSMGAALVVLPAYNEEQSLPSTLRELRDTGAATRLDLAVVDDGSSDGTGDAATAAGAVVLRLPYNLGVGAAVRTGLRYAVERGYERVVVVDADGQHAAHGVAALLAALDDGADVAIGSRFAGAGSAYAVGRLRRGGMRLLAGVVRRLVHQRFTDVTSGFRAFDRKAVEFLAREYPVEYLADTVEVLLKCHAAGFTIAEVPIAMRQRAAGVPSTRNVKLVVNYLRLLIGIASWGWRRSLPARAPDRKEPS